MAAPSSALLQGLPSARDRLLQVNHLTVAYREVRALEDITVAIAPGRLTGVIGPNGAGKSTLMKALLGLVPSQGSAVWAGKALLEQRDRLAYLPQRAQIDWTYPATAWDVVMMGRVAQTGWLRRFSAASRASAQAALARVEMLELARRPIGQLSGGQQQRVFLARALTQNADLLFLDEPFTGVDQKTEAILFDILQELAQSGKIVVVVHHDLGAAIQNFDDLILLNRHLIASGPRQRVLRDAPMEQAYGGYVNFLRGAA